MSSDAETPYSQALQFISAPRFHQEFTLEATSDHESLSVSYADVGRGPDTDATSKPPTILMMPGMFASRFLAVGIHRIAEKSGVRILVVDRPGMGKSTDVPLAQRLSIWLELVPRLLAHLKIDHVSLVSHSAGTIYLLNTLYHHRNLLHPKKPLAALLAPWVDPSHSHVRTMQAAQLLPIRAFSVWHLLPPFVMFKAQPAFMSSASVVTNLTSAFSFTQNQHGDETANPDDPNIPEMEKSRRILVKDYGVPRDLQTELATLSLKFMFEENTVGANSEALQCLKKGASGTWGQCENYQAFVRDLIDLERNRGISQGLDETVNECAARGPEKLKVRMFFAETDAMIGKKGQAYMEECWRGRETGQFDDVLDFQTTTVKGTDHDSLVQIVPVLEAIFADARVSL